MRLRLNFLILCLLISPVVSFGQKSEPTPPEDCDFISTADLSDAKAPKFTDFPTTSVKVASTAGLDLNSNPIARTYQTVLRQEMAEGPNFAGHYKVALWGCGMACAMFAVVDLNTGKVITPKEVTRVLGTHLAADDFLPDTASNGWGFRFKKDSALMVVVGTPDENKSRSGAYYFVLRDETLRLIHTTRITKNCERANH
jgi:hypothetical protein